jgi:50S ribosomal protein L16 3-hydroxylase
VRDGGSSSRAARGSLAPAHPESRVVRPRAKVACDVRTAIARAVLLRKAMPMATLARWLGPLSLDQFLDRHLTRAPWAAPGGGLAERRLFDWPALERVLAAPAPPDVLVVSRGEHLPLPAPRTGDQARLMMDAGIGMVLRRSERADPALAALASDLVGDVPGTAHVQLFVTPRRTHGFGWHYDDEDVFILQTQGVKDYYFRANTVAADQPARGAMFARFAGETSPLGTACLVPGDFLYLPSRWWHMAVAQEESLSISVGVFSDAARARREPRAAPTMPATSSS